MILLSETECSLIVVQSLTAVVDCVDFPSMDLLVVAYHHNCLTVVVMLVIVNPVFVFVSLYMDRWAFSYPHVSEIASVDCSYSAGLVH